MANLLQAVKFENKTANLLKEENNMVIEFENIISIYKQSLDFLGETLEFKEKINKRLKNECNIIRERKWKELRKLPSKLTNIYNCDGQQADIFTALNLLPKVKISEFKKLADKFNMIIIPIEYTEIDKLFDIQENSNELKRGFNYFKELLRQDTTTQYQCYLLCPIDYYNVWEQIKSDVVKNIYYSNFFETIFSTLELLIPSQKNLYLATKSNNENLKNIAETFDVNIKTLNNKITSISEKVNKLEMDFIKEKERNTQIQLEQKRHENELKDTILKQKQEIDFMYRNIDPILFAVPNDVEINTQDESTSIVGLCWGKDIDDMIFDMKDITIEHKDLTKINPINLEYKMKKQGFNLKYGKILNGYEYIQNIISKHIERLNNKRHNYSNSWSYNSHRNHIIYLEEVDLQIVFTFSEYERDYFRQLEYIDICDKNDMEVIKPIKCNDFYRPYYGYRSEIISENKFLSLHKKAFDELANRFDEYYNTLQ
ncbi:hypothetical protein [Clostridium sp.]|uniref:hypothetical protein n=1 Tax=Clostridium sp. TaxID=1506 RepID=UPI00262F48A6|nr:hypothetical protein [Clostridium sp.]